MPADAGLQDCMAQRDAGHRFYPSSKTCSSCGMVKAKLALSERTYQCDTCGLVMDRDVNAARNLLKLAASRGGERKRQGRDRKTVHRAGRSAEPGTRHPNQGQDRDRRPKQAAAA